MKNIILFLAFLFSLSSFTTNSEPTEIMDALKSGKAAQVSEFFDNFIDLTLPNKPEMNNVSKNQASIALKGYYEEAVVEGFTVSSKRESGSIMYVTGKLQGKFKNDNITIILKNTGGKYFITSIRIGL